jgi:CBS domain-containing protein
MVLLAKNIMDASILTVDEETDALTCARAMVAQRKGYAIVTRGGPKTVAGIVTEWDFLEKVVAAGEDPSRVQVKQLASPNPQSCSPETPTDEVVTTMAKLGIRRIVVRSGDQVVGIITTRNILASFRQYIDKLSSEIAGYQSPSNALG